MDGVMNALMEKLMDGVMVGRWMIRQVIQLSFRIEVDFADISA